MRHLPFSPDRARTRAVLGICTVLLLVSVPSAARALGPAAPRSRVPVAPVPGLTDPAAFVDEVLAGAGLLPLPEGPWSIAPVTPGGPGPARPEGLSRFVFPPLSVAGGPPQGALVGLTPGSFASFATGTVYHTDAILSGQDPQSRKNRLADIDLGFSGAMFSSARLPARTNELGRPLSPALEGSNGYGVGNAAEIGLDNPPDKPGQFELDDKSEVKAPPAREPVSKNLTKVDLNPVTKADLLRSGAAARAAGTGCVIGSDLASGMAEFTDTALVRRSEADAAVRTTAPQPSRGVSRSASRTYLTTLPGRPLGLFGLRAETRQTIAPLTILEGTEQQLTVELAGEWVLRASSDGVKGALTFGPEMEDPEIPLLRVFDAKGEPVSEYSMDELLTKEGRALDIADGVRLTLGEDTRAIGGDELSKPLTEGTLTAGAVDVVRIQLIDPETHKLSELRVGHMEAGVALPAGGVRCPDIGMVKESNPATVKAGDTFTWAIKVTNLNDCLLDGIKIVDRIKTVGDIGYEVVSTSPPAQRDGSTLTISDIGPVPFGASRTVSIRVRVADDADSGRFRDEATATGLCGPATVGGGASVDTPVKASMQGQVVLEAPEVAGRTATAVVPGPREILTSSTREERAVQAERAVNSARTVNSERAPRSLPRNGGLARTGGDALAVIPALGLIAGGRVLRGRSRRRR